MIRLHVIPGEAMERWDAASATWTQQEYQAAGDALYHALDSALQALDRASFEGEVRAERDRSLRLIDEAHANRLAEMLTHRGLRAELEQAQAELASFHRLREESAKCENCGKTTAEHDAMAHCWPEEARMSTPTDDEALLADALTEIDRLLAALSQAERDRDAWEARFDITNRDRLDAEAERDRFKGHLRETGDALARETSLRAQAEQKRNDALKRYDQLWSDKALIADQRDRAHEARDALMNRLIETEAERDRLRTALEAIEHLPLDGGLKARVVARAALGSTTEPEETRT